MQTLPAAALASLAAYLIGSLPFGLLTARLVAGIDIRQAGSGNIGATNVARVVGAKWGAVVLVLDALKGLLPVLLLPRAFLFPDDAAYGHLEVACGVAAIVGHMFPCWIGFRGGKGVATALGVVVVIGPWAALAAAIVFAIGMAAARIVSLSSVLASVAFAVCQTVLLLPGPFSPENWSRAAFSLLVPLLIIVRHRANLARLWRGEEPRFTGRQR